MSATAYISGLGLNATVDGHAIVLVDDPARGAADLVSLAAREFAAERFANLHPSASVPPGSHGNSALDCARPSAPLSAPLPTAPPAGPSISRAAPFHSLAARDLPRRAPRWTTTSPIPSTAR